MPLRLVNSCSLIDDRRQGGPGDTAPSRAGSFREPLGQAVCRYSAISMQLLRGPFLLQAQEREPEPPPAKRAQPSRMDGTEGAALTAEKFTRARVKGYCYGRPLFFCPAVRSRRDRGGNPGSHTATTARALRRFTHREILEQGKRPNGKRGRNCAGANNLPVKRNRGEGNPAQGAAGNAPAVLHKKTHGKNFFKERRQQLGKVPDAITKQAQAQKVTAQNGRRRGFEALHEQTPTGTPKRRRGANRGHRRRAPFLAALAGAINAHIAQGNL